MASVLENVSTDSIRKKGVKMGFFLLAGGLVVVLIPVVIAVVSSVVSGVAAAVDDEGDD